MALYYFVGEDEWEKKRKIREIATASGAKQFFEIDNTYPERPFEWLKSFVINEGLFSNNAVVVIKAFEKWTRSERTGIEKLMDRMRDRGTFIFSTDVIQGALARKIPKENILRFEIPKPWEERAWITWIKQKAAFIGVTVSDKACEAILDRVGTNANLIVSEIYKLFVYSYPDHRIDEREVEEVVFDYANKSTERLTNSIGRRVLSDAIDALYDLRASGINHILIISVIANYFHQLLKVRLILEEEHVDLNDWNNIVRISSALNLNRGRVAKLVGFVFGRKSGEQASKDKNRPYLSYTIEEMKDILLSLFDLDIEVKSTALDPWFSILEFLCEKIPKVRH